MSLRMARAATAMALLIACMGVARAAAPDPARCPPLGAGDASERTRQRPLPVPAALADLARASVERYAVSTLAGGTVCADTRFIEEIESAPTLSADRRFLGFGWSGYEAGGYLLVDRGGKGRVIETGAAPVFSPSRGRLAAVEWSESGFGALNGFAVWQVAAEGVKDLALIEDIPPGVDWRVDAWSGEDCVDLSAVAYDVAIDGDGDLARAPRIRFAARPSGKTWKLARDPGGCAAR